MEQVSRMAAEVNKLIGSSILAGKVVLLPGIGSLLTITTSNGTKRIDFSSIEQGTPLTDIIKDRAGCTPEQAQEIYSRWKSELYKPELTKVAGVGELRQKSFVTYDAFSTELNKKTEAEPVVAPVVPVPTPAAPKKVATAPIKPAAASRKHEQTKKTTAMSHTENKKKNNKGIIILILLFIIGIVIGYFTYNKVSESRAEKARIEQIAAEKAREQQRKADSIALAQIESRKAEEAAQSQDSTSPRYKVVYGVYDLRSNVDVAIKRISKKYGAERGKEYSFGAKTLVSMFESENRAECQRFLMENYDLYPDAWIYDSKQ